MNGKELKKEFGDYQTPENFAKVVCNLLHDILHLNPDTIIEPTSGIGNFLSAAMETFPLVKYVYGIEINKDYCEACKHHIVDRRLEIINDNFFFI
jgi:tRNA G46 methylase TrmB